ncbi:hypothetical protein FHG87_016280 [Trinorchestia longiramus]|nr:hypothetical protein FHG87_016280 [Trinorchestia longiramus]
MWHAYATRQPNNVLSAASGSWLDHGRNEKRPSASAIQVSVLGVTHTNPFGSPHRMVAQVFMQDCVHRSHGNVSFGDVFFTHSAILQNNFLHSFDHVVKVAGVPVFLAIDDDERYVNINNIPNTPPEAQTTGDFNFFYINWTIRLGQALGPKLIALMNTSSLQQHVNEPTRQNNILDLVITTSNLRIIGL